ncbi:hypothetical protein GMORB2_3568 [Geosmithia morbida]|uniref:Secreted protein n=1 Tax=Geosmithia morbida TaxID=1094350 RepID=A0A9P4YNL6_9HYPO|nr:uncharacterized protein GMORB2_3568 [Geosmithia morbida]KAF4119880.1 hypothetical protein GMORB2_3568 [Geosmithia morbida]
MVLVSVLVLLVILPRWGMGGCDNEDEDSDGYKGGHGDKLTVVHRRVPEALEKQRSAG